MSFTVEVIKRKYIKEEPEGGLQDATVTAKLMQKAQSFLVDYAIPSAKTVLLWAGRHDGLSLAMAHTLCRILNEKNFRPRVIVAANGISLGAPLKATCEINPETFPPSIYEKVYLVKGTVAVSNPTANGKGVSNKGSRNTVSYIVGVPRKVALNPWENPPLFPETDYLEVPVGTSVIPDDFGSDDPHISPSSTIIIVQANRAKALTEEFDKHLFTRAYEVLRATAAAKWAFIHFQPHPRCNPEELSRALDRKFVYRVPTSLVVQPTCESPRVGILKAAGVYTYKNRTPAHLEYIATYRTPKKAQPMFFPVGDFHVKVIFEDADDFPAFIEFLREANSALGSTWFTSLRQGGEDHSLFIGKTENEKRPLGKYSSGYRHSGPPAAVGNFILIEGIPFLFNKELIVKRATEAGVVVKRSFWGKNRDSDFRLVIETTERVPQGGDGPLPLFPK
jgi:hypothetical protein